jgi:hypothetical protein
VLQPANARRHQARLGGQVGQEPRGTRHPSNCVEGPPSEAGVGDLSNALSMRAHRSVRPACGTTLRSRDALRPSSYGESSRPSKQRAQGRPDAWPAPMARLQTKSRRQSPQVGRTTGLPCAMVGRLIRALPGDRLSCPRVATTRDTRCAGHQHRDARTTRFRRRIGYGRPREMTHAATRHAHRIPHPTSVTTAKRPLMRGRMAYQIINSEKKKQEFFANRSMVCSR